MKRTIHNQNNGFSLIELMVVVSIVGFLTAIATPKFATLKIKAARAEMNLNMKYIATALHSYYAENESYPTPHQIAGFQMMIGTSGTICQSTSLGLTFDNCNKLYYYYYYTTVGGGNLFQLSAISYKGKTAGMDVQYGATVPTNICKRPAGYTFYYNDAWNINQDWVVGGGGTSDALSNCF